MFPDNTGHSIIFRYPMRMWCVLRIHYLLKIEMSLVPIFLFVQSGNLSGLERVKKK